MVGSLLMVTDYIQTMELSSILLPLEGYDAAGSGDVRRNGLIIDTLGRQNAGLNEALTGSPARYGTKKISERLRLMHRNHMHFQRIRK